MYNVLIRPLIIEDANISWRWRNDKEIWKHTGNRPDIEITQEIESKWIANVIKQITSRRFAIIVDGIYVGNIQLTDLTDNAGQYHIFIGEKEYWGKGVAKSATYQILYFAKEVLKLKQVFLFVKKTNIAAQKVYEKSGFLNVSSSEDDFKMVCDLPSLDPPLVSIFCMVYNHEKYLQQCLDGFLKQKTNFSFEIVVGEDCSSDGSRKILIDYQKKFPGKFKLLLHKNNIGAANNQKAVLNNCSGKYVAMCEGDDYWTVPYKLQKQVDFLETHPDYEVCFTNINIIDSSGKKTSEKLITNAKKTTFLPEDMPIWSPTLTRVFKNRNFQELNDNVPGMDTFMLVYQSNFGKIKFLDEITGTYRTHGGGIYSSIGTSKKKIHRINTLMACIPIVSKEVLPKFIALILKLLLELKKLDKSLYSKQKKIFLSYNTHFKHLNFQKRSKFVFCEYLIEIPLIEKSNFSLNFAKKFINKLLVY